MSHQSRSKRAAVPSSNPDASATPSAAKRSRPSRLPRIGGSGAPTVRDLITDTLAPLANAYWAPGAPELQPFDPQIIETIYREHLAPENSKAKERQQREEQKEAAPMETEDVDAAT